MTQYPKTKRNTVKREPHRGVYHQQEIYEILDSDIICHVGFEQDGQPFVIPTLYARVEDRIILHGAKASRLLKHIQAGLPVCITVTHLDGLVLARSVFSHSVNYRSAMVFGRGSLVEKEEDKIQALKALTEHILPGRWADARPPTQKELNATSVIAVNIDEASAKFRTGPPKDDKADYDLPVWAGVLPIYRQAAKPEADSVLSQDISPPDYLFQPGVDWKKPG